MLSKRLQFRMMKLRRWGKRNLSSVLFNALKSIATQCCTAIIAVLFLFLIGNALLNANVSATIQPYYVTTKQFGCKLNTIDLTVHGDARYLELKFQPSTVISDSVSVPEKESNNENSSFSAENSISEFFKFDKAFCYRKKKMR